MSICIQGDFCRYGAKFKNKRIGIGFPVNTINRAKLFGKLGDDLGNLLRWYLARKFGGKPFFGLKWLGEEPLYCNFGRKGCCWVR